MVVGGRPRCVVCLKLEVRDRTIPPHIRCHRCDGPFYCGRECQQKHWHHGGHREKCRIARLEMGWFQGDGQNSLPLPPRDSAHDLVHAKKGWAPPGGWQQPDGSMHMLYHNGPSSFHAFSADGISWTERDDAPMFDTTVASSDSGKLQLKRRERPELVFAPKSGAPLLLLNGASADDPEGTYRAFSLVQHVGNNSSHDNDVRRS